MQLTGTRDSETGEVFYPPRALSADGRLRELDEVVLGGEGVLYSFAVVGETVFGLIDLSEGVRLQAELAPGEPEIGASYRISGDAGDWRFSRA